MFFSVPSSLFISYLAPFLPSFFCSVFLSFLLFSTPLSFHPSFFRSFFLSPNMVGIFICWRVWVRFEELEAHLHTHSLFLCCNNMKILCIVVWFVRRREQKDERRLFLPETSSCLAGFLHFLDSSGCTWGKIWGRICKDREDRPTFGVNICTREQTVCELKLSSRLSTPYTDREINISYRLSAKINFLVDFFFLSLSPHPLRRLWNATWRRWTKTQKGK